MGKSMVQNRSRTKKVPQKLSLPKPLLVQIHKLMVRSRVLEERLIKIYKSGEAFFWIGSPGEEGFGVPLGLLVKKGSGLNYDWLHLHYRGTPTLVALGMPFIDSIRLMMNRTTDPSTGGRNFVNHYCYPKWNVPPVSSTIETQYATCIGTAWAQKRASAKGITVVTGGDAGTAEGEFASALVWSSRKKQELPLLIAVTNNSWGISTKYEGQHGEKFIADRGKAFGMKTEVINGYDPVECYIKLKEILSYIRKEKKPVLLEALVSRIYGHSSATGATKILKERDGLREFETRLLKEGILKETAVKKMWKALDEETVAIQNQVRQEPSPEGKSAWNFVYHNNENADWRRF